MELYPPQGITGKDNYMINFTEVIASFVVNTPSSVIPAIAIDNAKKAVADTIGVILAGSESDVAPVILRYVEHSGEKGSSKILTGGRTAPDLAALANGTLGHALDYDDEIILIPGHPSVVLVPALLADAEGIDAAGRDFLEAYLLGLEVSCSVGVAVGSLAHYDRGWHSSSTVGLFGAVAALSRLHHLDVLTTRQAIGIAASMACGIQRNFGTMVKPFHAGWAARNAVIAVQLATEGLTAASDVLETKGGFISVYGTEQSNVELAVQRLGKPWAAIDPGVAIKVYPCCYGLHRSIDGMLQLHAEHHLTPENTASVSVTVPPGGLAALIYNRPKTGLEGKFCMEYALAASLMDGKIGIGSFTDEMVNRPEILELLPKIKVVEDPRVCPGDPQGLTMCPATRGFVEVQVSTRGGKVFTKRVDLASGSPKKGMTWDEVKAKFLDCAAYGGLEIGPAQAAAEILGSLEKCQRMSELIGYL
jgi:2-methylcitrate dehydratase PrpD